MRGTAGEENIEHPLGLGRSRWLFGAQSSSRLRLTLFGQHAGQRQGAKPSSGFLEPLAAGQKRVANSGRMLGLVAIWGTGNVHDNKITGYTTVDNLMHRLLS